MKKSVLTTTYKVFKTPQGYLHNVWEEWDADVVNHDFTDDPTRAMTFYGSRDYAPKYLWDFEKGRSIDTCDEMCEAFNGEFVTIKQTTTIEWEEI